MASVHASPWHMPFLKNRKQLPVRGGPGRAGSGTCAAGVSGTGIDTGTGTGGGAAGPPFGVGISFAGWEGVATSAAACSLGGCSGGNEGVLGPEPEPGAGAGVGKKEGGERSAGSVWDSGFSNMSMLAEL